MTMVWGEIERLNLRVGFRHPLGLRDFQTTIRISPRGGLIFCGVGYAFANCARGSRSRTTSWVTSWGENGTTSLRECYAESAGSTVVAVEDRSDRTGSVSDPGYAAVSDDQCGGSRGSVAQVDDFDLL